MFALEIRLSQVEEELECVRTLHHYGSKAYRELDEAKEKALMAEKEHLEQKIEEWHERR